VNKKEATEKRIQERRAIDENKRKLEVDFLKYQGQHLETFLRSINPDLK
jgi:dynein light intermediate chain